MDITYDDSITLKLDITEAKVLYRFLADHSDGDPYQWHHTNPWRVLSEIRKALEQTGRVR